MSELPEGWVATTLGDLGRWSSGGTPSKRKPEYYGGDIPWVRTGDLRDNEIHDVEGRISPKGLANSSAKEFPSGTLLVAMYGATIGRTGMLRIPATTNQACAALLPDPVTEDMMPFLWWFFRHKVEDFRAVGQGGAQPNISQTVIKASAIDLPPLPEQRRIVAKLDRLSARSAAARDHLARTTKLAARAKQAILARAFQGGLVNSSSITGARVPSRDELIRLRDERRLVEGLRKKGKNRSVPISSAVLPDVPDTWQWLTFDDCAWDMTVGHVGPMKDRYVGDGIPFLRSLNVKPNAISTRDIRYIDADFDEELRKSRLLPGDLVVVRTGEPGVAAVIDEDVGPCNCSDLVIS